MDKECYGEELPKVFNDLDGVGELVSQPDRAAHRVVDKIVLATSVSNPHIKTAIVCPPTIYGPGRGPDNQRSQQAYLGAKCILENKKGFMPGKGKNVWHEVHVQDLSELYLLLGEAAASGSGKATWNEQGYYLAENGSFAWGNVFSEMTKIAYKKGLIPTDECPGLEVGELKKLLPYGHLMWGTNSRGVSQRGKTLLGWKPVQRNLMGELPDIVEGEAKALGLIRGHAVKVTQE
jgi:nucleoside-diphosphate-sugar epimerase